MVDLKYKKHQVMQAALKAGFMMSTIYGQGTNKLMPVTDVGTLMKFLEEYEGIKSVFTKGDE